MSDEEQRAADYRAQRIRRARAIAARAKALAGDPALRAELARNWAPVQLAQQERTP